MEETPNIESAPMDSIPVEAPSEPAPEVAQAPEMPDVTQFESFKKEFSDKLPDGISVEDYYKMAYGKDAPVAAEAPAPEGDSVPSPEVASPEASSEAPQEVPELVIPDAPEVPEIDEAAMQAKFDGWMDALDSGEVSDDVMGELQAHFNATPEMIEIFKLGREAKRAQAQASAAEAVGGVDNLNEILAWSASNLSAAERDTANAGLAGPQAAFVLQGLQARMQQSQSKIASAKQAEPSASGREAATTTTKSVVPFTNQQDMAAAMMDPRYGSDQTYTEWVYKRIAKSM